MCIGPASEHEIISSDNKEFSDRTITQYETPSLHSNVDSLSLGTTGCSITMTNDMIKITGIEIGGITYLDNLALVHKSYITAAFGSLPIA